MDNFKDISTEVMRIWEEENKVTEEEEEEDKEESHQETLNSGDSRCCELEYNKVGSVMIQSNLSSGVIMNRSFKQ